MKLCKHVKNTKTCLSDEKLKIKIPFPLQSLIILNDIKIIYYSNYFVGLIKINNTFMSPTNLAFTIFLLCISENSSNQFLR